MEEPRPSTSGYREGYLKLLFSNFFLIHCSYSSAQLNRSRSDIFEMESGMSTPLSGGSPYTPKSPSLYNVLQTDTNEKTDKTKNKFLTLASTYSPGSSRSDPSSSSTMTTGSTDLEMKSDSLKSDSSKKAPSVHKNSPFRRGDIRRSIRKYIFREKSPEGDTPANVTPAPAAETAPPIITSRLKKFVDRALRGLRKKKLTETECDPLTEEPPKKTKPPKKDNDESEDPSSN